MRYQYDADADALLIELGSDDVVATTVEIDDARHVDLDGEGHPVRILWASHGVELHDLIGRFQLWDLKPLLEDIEQHSFKPSQLVLG